MTELICITCPRGCHLKVDERNGYTVTGNHCEKGAIYGKAELTHPVRVVTSTMKVKSAEHPRVSVKTSIAIPKEKIFAVMDAINQPTVNTPIHIGDILISHVCGTEADVVATKNIE